MSGGFDWIFWTVGGVLGLAGLLVALWALFADRARGRRRCPKCWYDLSGTPGLVCSECGYVAKRERRLAKTRRRWRWALAGALALKLGIGSALTPQVRRGGLASVVPTTVLIFAAPWLDTTQAAPMVTLLGPPVRSLSFADPLCAELVRRTRGDQLWDWQWRLLARRSSKEGDPPWKVRFVVPARGWADEPLVCVPVLECYSGRWPWFDPARLRVVASYAKGAVMGVGPGAGQTYRLLGHDHFITHPQDLWRMYGMQLANAPAQAQGLNFRLIVQLHKRSQSGARRWLDIWFGDVYVPLWRAEAAEDHLGLGREWPEELLEEAAARCLADQGLPTIRMYGPFPWDHQWLGVLDGSMEVVRDGTVVGSARFWVHANRFYFANLETADARMLKRLVSSSQEGSTWEVRFKTTYPLVVSELDSDDPRYWPREFTVPMCWDDKEAAWVVGEARSWEDARGSR